MSDVRYHSLRFDAGSCNGCLSCMRACPTQAVRVRRGVARLLPDRCIDCGECIKVCPEGAVLPLTSSLADLTRFDYTIAIPSPALYTQFEGDASPVVVHEALRRCGFDDVAGLSCACGAVTRAIEFVLADRRGPQPMISGFCPTVVRLVQENYPEMVGRLLPVLAPREIAAREAKARVAATTQLPPERIGAVYITPCPAKMVSIIDHPGLDRSHIDAVLSIRDLFQLLVPAVREVRREGIERTEPESSSVMSWAFAIGGPSSLPAEDTMAVAGLPNVIRVLDDIEKGKLGHYALIECHACHEGCVSGALTVENPYVARARAIRLLQTLGGDMSGDGDELLDRHRRGEFLLRRAIAARPAPSTHDLSGAIARMKRRERIRAYLPGIDCGACGSPSCEAFADDVAAGEADEQLCVFVRQRNVEMLVKQLQRLLAREPEGDSPSADTDGRTSPPDAAGERP
jgi:iron only hydrogenase large subunit-like protein